MDSTGLIQLARDFEKLAFISDANFKTLTKEVDDLKREVAELKKGSE